MTRDLLDAMLRAVSFGRSTEQAAASANVNVKVTRQELTKKRNKDDAFDTPKSSKASSSSRSIFEHPLSDEDVDEDMVLAALLENNMN